MLKVPVVFQNTSEQIYKEKMSLSNCKMWLLVILVLATIASGAHLHFEKLVPEIAHDQLTGSNPNKVKNDATKLDDDEIPNKEPDLMLPSNDANDMYLDNVNNENLLRDRLKLVRSKADTIGTQLKKRLAKKQANPAEPAQLKDENSMPNEPGESKHLDQDKDEDFLKPMDPDIPKDNGFELHNDDNSAIPESVEKYDDSTQMHEAEINKEHQDANSNQDADSYQRTDKEEYEKYEEYEEKLLAELLGGTGGLVDGLLGFVTGLVGTLVGGLTFAFGLPFGGGH